jgi:hypothetical protein
MPKRTKPIESLDPLARSVISALGGTKAVADIFGIKQPSVSGWLETGIPAARLMYLDVAYPEIMRKARKGKNGNAIDRAAASDDTQPPVGGSSGGEKLAKVVM